jgi:hypothetical protein
VSQCPLCPFWRRQTHYNGPQIGTDPMSRPARERRFNAPSSASSDRIRRCGPRRGRDGSFWSSKAWPTPSAAVVLRYLRDVLTLLPTQLAPRRRTDAQAHPNQQHDLDDELQRTARSQTQGSRFNTLDWSCRGIHGGRGRKAMVRARQYDTRIDVGSGLMKPEGEIVARGRIFLGDPETQLIYRVEPFAEFTRAQYLARHGGFPFLPEQAVALVKKILDYNSEALAVHEAGHIVVGLHHGCRIVSAHLPVYIGEIAITEFAADFDSASSEASQDILAAGCAAEAVALNRTSGFTSGVDRERMEQRFPSVWDAAFQRAVMLLEQDRTVFDAMSAALRDHGQLQEPEILRLWRAG